MQVLWGQVLWFPCKLSTDNSQHAANLHGAFQVSAHRTELPWVHDGQSCYVDSALLDAFRDVAYPFSIILLLAKT